MKKKITVAQINALIILKNTSIESTITARDFSKKMWPDSSMHTSVKNTGNGATAGKAGWLCGGSYLRRLYKIGLVYEYNGYYISAKGKEIVNLIAAKE